MSHSINKDLFISYGRRESLGLVGRLHQQLKLAGYDAWFDKVNIPDGEDYAERINHGIETAHNFAYVMAPRCLTSPYCLIELEYARILGKRVIPLNQMVIFQTDSRELSDGDQAVLTGFYAHYGMPDQQITNTQQVLDRSLALIGRTDWLDAKEQLTDDDCTQLAAWSQSYENYWHKHDEIAYLQTFAFPVFGQSTDSLVSVVERMQLVLERHKDYVHKHTEILFETLTWQRHQQETRFLLVGKERLQAEDWLLTEFIEGEQAPCYPNDAQCQFICESRKNSYNMMTHAFVCYDVADQAIRDEVVRLLTRHAITTWQPDHDTQEGTRFVEAIEYGIETADNFLYFMSPAAVHSEYCQYELAHALQYHKRIIPLLIQSTPTEEMTASIRALQYIDFTKDIQIDPLLRALRHEPAYYEQHKVLLARALKWQREQKKPAFLLRGHNLNHALIWLRLNQDRCEHPPTEHHHALISASEAAKGQLGTEVFISYSRKNGDFARKLNLALQEVGKTTWFDQESIGSGVDFAREIFKGIDGADNFIFIISPDAVESPYCEQEVNYASTQCKRLVPILWRSTDPETIPAMLRTINWIDFQTVPFGKAFPELIQTLDLDREHAHQHTVWQQRASDWVENERSDDFLLNKTACENAEHWQESALTENKRPTPTQLQNAFIQASRQAIEATERQERRQRNLILGSITGGMVLAIILSVFAFIQMNIAQEARRVAEEEKLRNESLFLASKAENSMFLASKARNRISKYQPLEAIAIALQGLPKPYSKSNHLSRPYVSEASVALHKAWRETPQSLVLEGHTGAVWSAVFSPDGQRVATASADKTARIWDSQTGKLLLVIQGHQGEVSSIAFETGPGQRLVTTSGDQTARIWDSLNGKELLVLSGHEDWVSFAAFSPDGQRIVTASEDKTVRIWDSHTGQLLKQLEHEQGVVSAVFSPDGQTVLTAPHDKNALLWDLPTGQLILAFKGHKEILESALFDTRGHRVVTASDYTATIWDSHSGNRQFTLEGHRNALRFATFSPNGSQIATVAEDHTVRLWDSKAGKLVQILPGHGNTVYTAHFSPDGQRLVSASSDQTARIWKVANEKPFLELVGHDSAIKSVTFSPDGHYLATASEDKTARVWNRQSGQPLAVLKGHDSWIRTIAFSPNGQRLVTASGDNTARIWESHNGQLLLKLEGHQEAVLSAQFSHVGDPQIVTTSVDNTVIIWDSQSGKPRLELKGHKNYVYWAEFSPDDQRLVTASKDNTARIWESHRGQPLLILKGHQAAVVVATFSADGHTILTASKDKTARIWDSHSGKLLSILEGHTLGINGAHFSPDGQYLATAPLGGAVRIWDSESGQLFSAFEEEMVAYDCAFSPDGRSIAIGLNNGTARVYPLPPPVPHFWKAFWYTFTPQQRYTLLLYLFDIDQRLWESQAAPERLHYLRMKVWPSLTPEKQKPLSIYMLRLMWQEMLWEQVTSDQFQQLTDYLSHPWPSDQPVQYYSHSLLLALEKQWHTFTFQQQERIMKSLAYN